MGLPIVQKEMHDDMMAYEAEFKTAVRKLKHKYGAEGMVFGDIYLDKYTGRQAERDP